MIADVNVRWLGRINFADALELQEELVAKKRVDREAADELLLLEHEAVYTIGRTPTPIEAILRWSIQTPVSPSRCVAAIP